MDFTLVKKKTSGTFLPRKIDWYVKSSHIHSILSLIKIFMSHNMLYFAIYIYINYNDHCVKNQTRQISKDESSLFLIKILLSRNENVNKKLILCPNKSSFYNGYTIVY